MNAQSAVSFDTTVQRLAEIMVALADPFACREAVLASAGLDAASWERMAREWIERIQHDASGALGLIYAEAFARSKAERVKREQDPQLDHDPRFLSAAQSWRGEAAAVSIDASGEAPRLLTPAEEETWPCTRTSNATADLDMTAEIALQPWKAELPFVAARAVEESGIRPGPALCRVHESSIRPALHPTHTAESTMAIALFVPRTPALPFAPARPPCRRLHSFDSQTGLPLLNPYWSDDLVASADPTKPA